MRSRTSQVVLALVVVALPSATACSVEQEGASPVDSHVTGAVRLPAEDGGSPDPASTARDGASSPIVPSKRCSLLDEPPGSTRPAVDPSSCRPLTGTYDGTADGVLVGTTSARLSGTARLELVPSTIPGEFTVTPESRMELTADVAPDLPVSRGLAGTVRCDVLDQRGTEEIIGLEVHYRTSCVFDAEGCKGTWIACTADDAFHAEGTFEVRRTEDESDGGAR